MLPHNAKHSMDYAVASCPSVCLSVKQSDASVYCNEKAKCIPEIF